MNVSSFALLTYGVPQGLILDPIMFQYLVSFLCRWFTAVVSLYLNDWKETPVLCSFQDNTKMCLCSYLASIFLNSFS